MTKPILDERFADWVDGRLKPVERAALEAELARDPSLAQAAEEYRRTVQLLRGALAPTALEGSAAEASVADAVLARLEPTVPLRPRLTIRPVFASVIAAAALVLAFVIVRAIPPAPLVDVTETAKSETASRGVASDSDNFYALRGVRPADLEPAPARDAGDVNKGAEGMEVDARALLSRAERAVEEKASGLVDQAQRKRAQAPSEEEVAARRAVSAPAPTPQTVSPKTVPPQTESAKNLAEPATGAKVAAEAPTPVVGADLEAQLGQWAAGLGELALVVEPGATDARAADPLALLTGIASAGAFSGGQKDEAVRDEVQLGFAVREVVNLSLGAARRADREVAADDKRSDDESGTLAQHAESLAASDRVFVVSGSADAVRRFARDLQTAVAARDGRVHVERSQPLAKAVGGERTRARQAGAGGGSAAATGKAPGSASSATAAPPAGTPARVELHVIVRARPPERGR